MNGNDAERARLWGAVADSLHFGRRAEAEALCRHMLVSAPADEAIALRLADLLHEEGRLDDAAACLDALLVQVPGSAAGHHLRAIVAFDGADLDLAQAHAARATALAPGLAAAWSNLGMVLKTQGAFAPAFAAHDRAVALAPGDPQIRLNRAVALLRAGRMREAWPDYESRLRLAGRPGAPALAPDRLLPSLDGGVDLAGRTVLVTHEEGFGDTLQFLRYVPMLAAKGARVIAWVPPPLARLVRGTAGLSGLLSGPSIMPPYDFHCPVFSLPRAFGTELATIPAAIPYLRADRALVNRWAPCLPRGDGLRVGLAWAGQARPWLPGFSALDTRRSIALDTLAPLASVPGARFVSLQLGGVPGGFDLCDPMPGVADFADTAAIVAQLDLVVSVDTSVVHLAGGLGVPVFLLDRFDSCWRWLADRTDSPWYPGLRIFRQERMGEWASPVARLRTALAALAASAARDRAA